MFDAAKFHLNNDKADFSQVTIKSVKRFVNTYSNGLTFKLYTYGTSWDYLKIV